MYMPQPQHKKYDSDLDMRDKTYECQPGPTLITVGFITHRVKSLMQLYSLSQLDNIYITVNMIFYLYFVVYIAKLTEQNMDAVLVDVCRKQ